MICAFGEIGTWGKRRSSNVWLGEEGNGDVERGCIRFLFGVEGKPKSFLLGLGGPDLLAESDVSSFEVIGLDGGVVGKSKRGLFGLWILVRLWEVAGRVELVVWVGT